TTLFRSGRGTNISQTRPRVLSTGRGRPRVQSHVSGNGSGPGRRTVTAIFDAVLGWANRLLAAAWPSAVARAAYAIPHRFQGPRNLVNLYGQCHGYIRFGPVAL